MPTGLEENLIPAVDTPADYDTLAGLPGTYGPSPFVPNGPTDTGGNPTGTQPVLPTNGGGAPTGGLPAAPIIPTGPNTPITPVTPISPVPEPGTLVLLLTGLATIPFAVRMRRKARTT